MSNYSPIVDYAAKDALTTGDPNKKILGTQVSGELNAISTAVTSKEDVTNKNAANGYAGLDSSGALADARLTASNVTQFQNTTAGVGYLGVPQNSQSSSYTLVLADAGKQIFHASGAGASDVYTIPANASVAFPIGTVVTFVNLDTNAVSIAITSDTLTLAGTTTTGTRSLAQNGFASAVKMTSTLWLISGPGLS